MTPEQASTRIGERFTAAHIEAEAPERQVGPPIGRTDEPALAGRVAQRPDPGGGGPLVVTLPVEQWLAFAQFAKDDLRCRFFSFLTAVDWKDAGLEVVVKIDNVDDNLSMLMKTRLGPGVSLCPSLTPLYRGANWMEREAYEMFGIQFEGHPDLRHLLLTDDWEGHPLLKSYAVDTPHPPYR